MSIEHTIDPSPPSWPEGFTVRSCIGGLDEPAVHAVVSSAFEDHWSMGPMEYDDWLKRNTGEGFDPALWFQVEHGATGEIVAAAVCRHFGDTGWVRYLGVLRQWRRNGIGEGLLRHTFGEFYRRGTRVVQLGVDAQNPSGASRLYERVGMTMIRQHASYEKVLRDGADWDEPRD